MKKFITYNIDKKVFLTPSLVFDNIEWEHLGYVIDFSYQSNNLKLTERKAIEYIKQELNFHIGSKCYLQNRCIGFDEIPLTHSLDDAYIIMDIVVDITEGLFRLRISKGIEEFFNNDFEDVLLEDVVLNIKERISYIRKCHNEFPKINDSELDFEL